MQRKLTVIPSAEAVGYSSLMECYHQQID